MQCNVISTSSHCKLNLYCLQAISTFELNDPYTTQVLFRPSCITDILRLLLTGCTLIMIPKLTPKTNHSISLVLSLNKPTKRILCKSAPNPLVCWTHYLIAWAKSTHFHCSTGWPFSCRRVSNCCRPAWSAGPPARVKSQKKFRSLHTLNCHSCYLGLKLLCVLIFFL